MMCRLKTVGDNEEIMLLYSPCQSCVQGSLCQSLLSDRGNR